MSSINFRRLDENAPHEQIRKALRALEDALFFVNDLGPSHSFWLVGFDGDTVGVIGFYKKKSVRYFAFSIYPEFRGGIGGQIFDIFYKLHCGDSFCIKTLDEEHFRIAEHIYSKKPLMRYQIGKKIIYINGGKLFGFKVLLIEFFSFIRSKIQ
jgi:hypothetical protein